MNTATPPKSRRWSWRQAKHRLAHSIKLRLVLVFLLLAAAMTFVFITGAQKAFSLGWREAARPLLMDYVNRLTADISPDAHSPPSVERAHAITQRLPLTIDIAGPQVNWQSHPGHKRAGWQRDGAAPDNAPSRRTTGAAAKTGRPCSRAPRQTATPSNSASTKRCLNGGPAWWATHWQPCWS
jgi:hypothetical protein